MKVRKSSKLRVLNAYKRMKLSLVKPTKMREDQKLIVKLARRRLRSINERTYAAPLNWPRSGPRPPKKT